MSATEAAFAARHALLKEKFALRTCAEAERLSVLIMDLDVSAPEPAFAEIHHIAHRLAGGAGVFGLNELTQPAMQVEDLITARAMPDAVAKATMALVEHIKQVTAPLVAAAGTQEGSD